MKKKIATLLTVLFMCLSIFTGCTLFDTNNYAGLSAVVATSGNISVTREQLINAYNNSGYYYDNYYGYTREEAVKKTIQDLIDRQYLLNYIEAEYATRPELKLNKSELYNVVKETWDYIDSSIANVVKEVRKELNISSTELSSDSESSTDSSNNTYKPKTVYKQQFELLGDKVVKAEEVDNEYVPESFSVYDYQISVSASNKDLENLVWNRYLTSLKIGQKYYNYADCSDQATFNRELDRVYKTNLENAKLSKFEKSYSGNFGLDYDNTLEKYYINNNTLKLIAEKYEDICSSNKELYDFAVSNNPYLTQKNIFYNTLTNSSTRANFLYYGPNANNNDISSFPKEDEKLLTCMHILVKFTTEQTNDITKIKDNPLLDAYKEEQIKEKKSASNTLATERDEEGKEIKENTKSVQEIYEEIVLRIQNLGIYYTAEEYLEKVVEIFDEYVYTYNQDQGIMNATFDYVVGTKTSNMVNSFTEVVRKLYNNGTADFSNQSVKADYNSDVTLEFPYGVGYAGAISSPFLEEAQNYTGYHIVLFTGTLSNIEANNVNAGNVYQKLGSVKTSVAYNQSIFEYIFDKVKKDNYNIYQKQLLASISKAVEYNTGNFKDMY